MTQQKLKEFIKQVFDTGEFDGCYYGELGRGLYLVFAYDYNNKDLDAKIAYNSDDLQSDYEFDWYEPQNTEGDYIGRSFEQIHECGYTVDELVQEVVGAYHFIIDCGWTLPE